MRPLHIAFFNRAFYPEVSATGQLLTELAQGLVKEHGCRVSVVAGFPQGQTHGVWIPPKGRRLVLSESLGQISILRARGTTWSKRTFVGRVMNYLTYFSSACLAGLQLERPDLVIALTDPPVIGLAGLLAARRFRCPLVISYRDLFPEVARLLDNFQNPLVEQVLHRVNRILIRSSVRIIALGEAMRARLIEEKKADPQKVVVIPDWADGDLIVPGPKRNPFSLTHGLADRFVVMHSGNMGVSQNLEVLLRATMELRDLADLTVVFMGDGVRKASLQEQATARGLKNVMFLPYQPKENLTEAFASADCFVISLKPGLAGYIMPSKLYGILAAGRPYVAAVDDDCDVAGITHRYRCGLLAPPGNPERLAQQVRILYQDRSLVRQLGENARQAFGAFDRAKGVRSYFNLCLELCNTK